MARSNEIVTELSEDGYPLLDDQLVITCLTVSKVVVRGSRDRDWREKVRVAQEYIERLVADKFK
jgi:hypothetical protein